jgi:hypothetical protein
VGADRWKEVLVLGIVGEMGGMPLNPIARLLQGFGNTLA